MDNFDEKKKEIIPVDEGLEKRQAKHKDRKTFEEDKFEKKGKEKIRFKPKKGPEVVAGEPEEVELLVEVKKDPAAPEIVEKVISINRITKVTKGGKKLSFSALVVVGNADGKVGYSLSKAAEVSIAIKKAVAQAKKNMVRITMKGSTIPHEIIGECGGARVLLKPAAEGTGVIAAGPVRAVCDGAGIHDILTKCHRSNNPINVVKATFDGLARLKVAS